MAEAAPRFAPFLDGLWDASTQVQQNVYRRTAEALAAGRAANDLLLTPHDVRRRQEALRRLALDALGGDLPPDRPAPVARRTGSVRGDGHLVERLIVDVGDGVHIPANLYLPDGLAQPAGAVLFLCGHAPSGKAAPRYQAMCARLARAGLVTLSFDTIGQGERKSYLDASGREIIPANVPEHSHAGVQCWWTGDSLARYFVSDARRMLDYLTGRPEVDPRRVGVMGNSGGGTLTTWLMLVEPRLAAAAPSCFVSSREDYQRSGQAQDPEQIIPGGALHGLDHEDFLLAMAPRPALVMSANYDFFPVEGAVRTVARGRRFYQVMGSSALEHVRADGGHGLSPELAVAASAFFQRHLGGSATVLSDEPALQPDEALQCTVSGQISTDVPGSAKVFDLNMRRLAELDRREAGGGLPWLRARVNAGRRPREEFYPRWWEAQEPGVRKALWWAEHDIVSAAVVFDPPRPATGVDIVLLDRGTDDLPAHADACRRAARSGRHVVVMDVRASGALTPHRLNEFAPEAMYGTTFKLVSDLIGLADSLGAARVYDVLRAVEFARSEPGLGGGHDGGLGGGLPIRLVGAGQGAFLARLAGALEPGVAEVVCLTPALDPADLVRTRFYGPERDHQCLIPGMAHHCPKDRIDQALGARLIPGERWLTGEPLARVPSG